MKEIINKAIKTLKKGGVILIPTETVYGIAVDATNKAAIDKIYKIKQRDATKPLQLLVKSLEVAEKYVVFNDASRKAAEKYWAGALTLILNEVEGGKISENLKVLNRTIGVRVPSHLILQELLELADFPLAATSANISGQPALTKFIDAKSAFENKLDYFIDGGDSELGMASTVADLRDENNIKILRQGGVVV